MTTQRRRQTDVVAPGWLGRGRRFYAVPDRTIAPEGWVPLGRALHIVDIESLMGGPLGDVRIMADAAVAYREASNVQPFDHVIVGANPRLIPLVSKTFLGAQLRTKGGPNGADLALLSSLSDIAFIATHYFRVVIGSGDGIFLDAVRGLRSVGVPVQVVSRPRSLGYLLGHEADSVILLPTLDSQVTA